MIPKYKAMKRIWDIIASLKVSTNFTKCVFSDYFYGIFIIFSTGLTFVGSFHKHCIIKDWEYFNDSFGQPLELCTVGIFYCYSLIFVLNF